MLTWKGQLSLHLSKRRHLPHRKTNMGTRVNTQWWIAAHWNTLLLMARRRRRKKRRRRREDSIDKGPMNPLTLEIVKKGCSLLKKMLRKKRSQSFQIEAQEDSHITHHLNRLRPSKNLLNRPYKLHSLCINHLNHGKVIKCQFQYWKSHLQNVLHLMIKGIAKKLSTMISHTIKCIHLQKSLAYIQLKGQWSLATMMKLNKLTQEASKLWLKICKTIKKTILSPSSYRIWIWCQKLHLKENLLQREFSNPHKH